MAPGTTPTQSPGSWAELLTPAVSGVPYTAPIYREAAMNVQAVPVVSGCMAFRPNQSDCRCYTQQGTRIRDMSLSMCKRALADGVFNPGHTLCEGVAAISEFAVKTHEAMPLMRHNATNVLIDGEGDSATGSAFLLGYIAGSDHKVITTGRYQDKLTKTDDGWRFRERVYAADA